MKFLIWFMCFFVCAVIQVIIKNAGFILGGIPAALLFGLTYLAARSICKRWDQHRAAKKAKAAEVTPVEEAVAEQDSAPVPKKQRYCKFCGGEIDGQTKQCEKCGKRYFRFRVTPKCLLATGQCLLVLALVAVIICQYAQYKADIAALTEKVENLDMQCLRKESEIKELQYDIHYAETRLEFYNKHVVFVPADGAKYHKLGCRYFNPFWVTFDSSSQFYALDDDMAEYLGYIPCSKCCD